MDSGDEKIIYRLMRRRGRKIAVLAVLVVVLFLGGNWGWRQVRASQLRGPLVQAVAGGYTNQVRLLLDQGAEPDAPLRTLPLFDRSNMLSILQGDGNRHAGQQYTVLMEAARRNDTATVRVLLEKGALVNRKANRMEEWTPLHYAADSLAFDTMQVLLDAGADVDARDAYRCTPLHRVGGGSRSSLHAGQRTDGTERCAALLLRHGADLNARDQSGRTPLMVAVETRSQTFTQNENTESKARDLALVKLLIQHGADRKAKDSNGVTALDMAKDAGDKEVLSLLEAAEHAAPHKP